MDNSFPEIKTYLGFGCMRLPMNGENVDIEEFRKMTDSFIAKGFNYFDTAHGYIDGKSEKAIKEALTDRYLREAYILTNKLTGSYFNSEEEIRPLFDEQLKACGVEYFDFYLMHAQTKEKFEKFKACRAYETAFELKKEGKVKHVGLSFHDKAEVLDEILSEYPQIEIVQIQLNYLDYDDLSVDGRRVYEVARKHGKPIIVMEPVKGGSLVNLPAKAQRIFDELGGGSNAEYAIRYVGSFDGVRVVLSGMSNMEQIEDNMSYMNDFKVLSPLERIAVEEVKSVFKSLDLIPCTACHYCIEESHCPKNILIPDIFSCLNSKYIFEDWNMDMYYEEVLTANGHAKASECIECGLCEKVCPQRLQIRRLLKDAANKLECSEE